MGFRNNNFFIEKNPTIVTFPLKGLDLRDYIHPDCQPANPETKYDLVANVCHDGKPEQGTYKVQVFHNPTSQWFELHDLRVTPVLPDGRAHRELHSGLSATRCATKRR